MFTEGKEISFDKTKPAPVLTFFNNKGGIGKTFLAYHLAHMLSETGERVLACDLDPQSGLTASFLSEDKIESLWEARNKDRTVYQCAQPLTETGDLREPKITPISDTLGLIPGDMGLSNFEEFLSKEWVRTLGGKEGLYRSFRVTTAFWQIMQGGAANMNATIILVDVGSNLGILNRSALIASDFVMSPVSPDLYSLQGLKNTGTTLMQWRREWTERLNHWSLPDFPLPAGAMNPQGYIVSQPRSLPKRPVTAHDKWIARIPDAYHRHMLYNDSGTCPEYPSGDEFCLATIKPLQSLVAMAQEARKPIFHLRSADGAIGSHAKAVAKAGNDFNDLADLIRSGLKATATVENNETKSSDPVI